MLERDPHRLRVDATLGGPFFLGISHRFAVRGFRDREKGFLVASTLNCLTSWFRCRYLILEDFVRICSGRLTWRMGSDLVSFPIATYSRVRLLTERTIPSILAQTHSNVEVVVVADGTLENELAPLRALKDPRVRIVRLKKRTKYPVDPVSRWMVAGWKPRNVGSRKSRGSWIYWISDDDFLLPHAVQTLLRVAKDGDFESVSGGYQLGLLEPVSVLPEAGIEALGLKITGPPAWLSKRYVGGMRWNRASWRKVWNRPSDYDLIERMRTQRVRFGHTDDVVAVQPEVDGTGATGLRGSLAADSKNG